MNSAPEKFCKPYEDTLVLLKYPESSGKSGSMFKNRTQPNPAISANVIVYRLQESHSLCEWWLRVCVENRGSVSLSF